MVKGWILLAKSFTGIGVTLSTTETQLTRSIAQVKSSLKQDLNDKLQTDKSWLNQFITLAQSFVIDGGSASQEKVHERLQQTKNLLAHCREKEDAKAIRTSSELLRLINWLEIEWLN